MTSRISYPDCGLKTPPDLTWNNKGFLPFPLVKTVTTVMISYFNQSVDCSSLFYFLKLGRLSFEDERKINNGYLPEKTGTILKAKILIKNNKFYRGMSDKKNPFKNAITMWISEGSKMVSARVSRTSIHMTGITSTKMAVFVSQLVFDHLESVEKLVQEMNSNMEKTNRIIQWILSNSKGDIIVGTQFNKLKVPENYPDCIPGELNCELLHRFVEIIPDCGNYQSYQMILSHIKTIKTIFKDNTQSIQESSNLLSTGKNLLLKINLRPRLRVISKPALIKESKKCPICLGDFKSDIVVSKCCYQKFCFDCVAPWLRKHSTCSLCRAPHKVDQLFSLKPNVSKTKITLNTPFERNVEKLRIKNVCYSMYNHSYHLGFEVDRERLNDLINDEYSQYGFRSLYNRTSLSYVLIKLRFDIPEKYSGMIKKKREGNFFTFIVFGSGSVTQSGPCLELNRLAYTLFRSVIALIRTEINTSQYFKLPCCRLTKSIIKRRSLVFDEELRDVENLKKTFTESK